MSVINLLKHNDGTKVPISLYGDSISNLYVPWNAMFTGERKRKGNLEVLMYNLHQGIGKDNGYLNEKRYPHLFQALEDYTVPKWFVTETASVLVGKGQIFQMDGDKPIIRMMLGVRSDYIFKADKDKLDYSNFALFVSNSFASEESLRLLYKKLAKDYFSELSALGVDIIYTSSIEKWMFNNSMTKPNFSTIKEMKLHLSNLNQEVTHGEPKPPEQAFDIKRRVPTDFEPVTISARPEDFTAVPR